MIEFILPRYADYDVFGTGWAAGDTSIDRWLMDEVASLTGAIEADGVLHFDLTDDGDRDSIARLIRTHLPTAPDGSRVFVEAF